jgi:hypothetical protein
MGSGLIAVLVVGAIVLALALAMALAAWFADPTDPARMSSPWRHDVRLEGTLDANAVTAGSIAGTAISAGSLSATSLNATSLNAGAAVVSGSLTAGSLNTGSLNASAASFTNLTTSGLSVLTDAQIGGRVNAADGLFMPMIQMLYSNGYAPTWDDPVTAGAAFPFDARILGLRLQSPATTYASFVDTTAAADYNLYQNDEWKAPLPPTPPSVTLTGGYALLSRPGRWLVHLSLAVRGAPAGLPEFQVGLVIARDTAILANLPRALQDRGGTSSRVLTAPMKTTLPLPGAASLAPAGATAYATGMLTVTVDVFLPTALVPIGIRSAGPAGAMTQERTTAFGFGSILMNSTFMVAYYLGRG